VEDSLKTVAVVVAILVVLLVVALVVLAARRNRRRALLRERFGPEYDLAVRRGHDRRTVEQRLEALAEQRDSLQIRDVAVEEHERFSRQWADVQGRFVDDPGQAVADADGLVNAVLRSRGYPMESFDDRIALVATDHQDIVEGYRSAHDTFAEHLRTGGGETERLRQAFLHYREVFGRLNEPAERGRDQGRALGAGEEPPAVEAAPSAEASAGPPAESAPADARAGRPVSGPAPAVAAEPVPAEAPRPGGDEGDDSEAGRDDRPAGGDDSEAGRDDRPAGGDDSEAGRIAVNTPAGVPPAMPPTVAQVPPERPAQVPPSEADDGTAARLDEAEARERSGVRPRGDRS
jgi:hypothetical protein